ncbi:MAG: Adenine DNA glycosylase [Chlamydiae bacterium]|nr:Adenine DNA glycosylase [Chlamydiota bacterium]
MDLLNQWFMGQRRSLPWRESPTPYRVWVSEVMLQQTQVMAVIPYFERFMAQFPTIEALANAREEQVVKAWEGLGYYSRARSLHQGAQFVLEEHGGRLPSEESKLREIKGIGPYTQGAIRSFAFHQKAAAVDGNVARVVSRLFEIEEEITSQKTLALVRGHVLDLIPEKEPWVTMEALIELGALVCTKLPKCQECPLADRCLAHRKGREKELPIRRQTIQYVSLDRFVPVICYGEYYLLRKEVEDRVMQGLWQFPYFENGKGLSVKTRARAIKERWALECVFREDLPSLKQTFTKFRATLFPSIWFSREKSTVEGFSWKHHDELKSLSFCAGHRKIAEVITR